MTNAAIGHIYTHPSATELMDAIMTLNQARGELRLTQIVFSKAMGRADHAAQLGDMEGWRYRIRRVVELGERLDRDRARVARKIVEDAELARDMATAEAAFGRAA